MVCRECGKEIADGLDYCTECGAPVEEPIVIKMSKDDIKKANKDLDKKTKEQRKSTNKDGKGKNVIGAYDESEDYEGEFINLVGYGKSLGSNINNLLALIGAILLYVSPFMTWLYQKLHGFKTTGNLFELGGKVVKDQWGTAVNAKITLGSSLFVLYAVIILLSGFCMMVFSARRYIKPMWKFRNKYLIRFIPAITSIIAFVLVFTNKYYKEVINNYKSLKDIAKSSNSSNAFSYGNGLGPILCIAGIAIYIISILFDAAKKHR